MVGDDQTRKKDNAFKACTDSEKELEAKNWFYLQRSSSGFPIKNANRRRGESNNLRATDMMCFKQKIKTKIDTHKTQLSLTKTSTGTRVKAYAQYGMISTKVKLKMTPTKRKSHLVASWHYPIRQQV